MSEATMSPANGALRITLVRSTIGRPADQERTVRALGLRRLHHTVERPDNPSIRGMVTKIHHLVKVEAIAAGTPPAAAAPTAGGGPGVADARFVHIVDGETGDQPDQR